MSGIGSGIAALRRLVRDGTREAGSYRLLAARSGGLVSVSTLNSIATGKHAGRLSEATLRGIAAAVDRPATEVAALVGVELADELPPFVLPRRADRLTQPQRRVVVAVVDAILTAAEAERARRSLRSPFGPRPATGEVR